MIDQEIHKYIKDGITISGNPTKGYKVFTTQTQHFHIDSLDDLTKEKFEAAVNNSIHTDSLIAKAFEMMDEDTMEIEIMDINSCYGTRIRYLNRNGYDSDREYANRFLLEGNIYTVDYTDIHSWTTNVYLKEFPGKSFNSVMFGKIEYNEA